MADPTMHDVEDKKAMDARLARIEGQVRAVRRMIAEDVHCEDIAQQLAAARKALDRAFYEMVSCMIRQEPPAGDVKGLVDWYKAEMPKHLERVLAMDAAKLAAVVDFFGMKMPNAHFLVWQATHNAHHRGQLSTYLRPMGAKVPQIYGPSGDEP